ncbi:MAG: peptidoglycan-binding protein [Minisyncoccia bacterium]
MIKGKIAIAFAMIFSCAIIFAAAPVHAQSADTQPPTVPSGLSATAIPSSQVSLSWSASTDDIGVVGYYVYRNGVEIVSSADTSFIDSGLAPGMYSYTVAAYDAAGNVSQESNPVAVTLVLDTTAPTVPGNFSVAPASLSTSSTVQAVLSWSASTDNVGVAGYSVYRNGALISGGTAVTGTTYTDSVSPGTYTYQVAAYDAAQNFSSYSSSKAITIVFDNTPPNPPTDLVATQVSLAQVNLSWLAPADNIAVTGYDMYRNGLGIGTVEGTSYTDAGVVAGSLYSYTVAAYDAAGNVSAQSAGANITVNSDLVPPSTPPPISTFVGSSSIRLSWRASSDALGIEVYDLYRNDVDIANLATTSYLDTAPAVGDNIYSVTAYNIGGISSEPSPSVDVLWYPAPSATVPLAAATATAPLPAPVVASTSVPVVQPSSSPVVTRQASQVISVEVMPASITELLSYGLRDAQVAALQSVLAANGYLAPTAATGFFGNLTLKAVQEFQCEQAIVCTGADGWGIVGPKTRAALNALGGGSIGTSTSSSSIASLEAEVQMLEQELQDLEARLK